MSIDKGKKKVAPVKRGVSPTTLLNETAQEDALVGLVKQMRQVDTESPLAKLNETSFSDNQGGRITYYLTQDMLKDAKKDKEAIRVKWLELQVKRRMLQKLLDEVRNISDHDYAHALEVITNAHKLMLTEGKHKFDRDVLWAASLLSDAKAAESILLKVSGFPKDKINGVEQLIKGMNDPQKVDEILLYTANEMADISSLGMVRVLLVSGGKGLGTKDALERQLNLLDKRYNRLRLESAKKLTRKAYQALAGSCEVCSNYMKAKSETSFEQFLERTKITDRMACGFWYRMFQLSNMTLDEWLPESLTHVRKYQG